jgi:rfaE bifunctional protein nucleotidyltransferase chain/domain
MEQIDPLNSKILNIAESERLLARLRFLNKTIVFTNGCFDIIHRGHIEYLLKASELGDVLLIGLNSDSSVKKIKGDNRPVQDQEARAKIIASMFFVSYVVIFDEETPFNLIKIVQPDILVKGGDYEIKDIVGYDIVTNKGGKVLTIPFVSGCSTTSIISKMVK